MAQKSEFPLYKVQKPMSSNRKGDEVWLFYTKRMREHGESIEISKKSLPDRLIKAMGRDYKVYCYLDIHTIKTCQCESLCECDVLYNVVYESREGSVKRTSW